ncbi:MAG TPA: hypothetical protein VGM60_18330 [Pseudonocardia sp.]|uniref:hypothetical protein n=1 Tax=Pseudonocardia sp. TaxID=60912 RepID=UPI002F42ECAB
MRIGVDDAEPAREKGQRALSDQAPEELGDAVLHAAVAVAREVLGEGLDAAFALGSLAHGSFAPLVSDIDLALVLTEITAGSADLIDLLVARAPDHSPLERRLSVFWSDWPGVRRGAARGRLPEVDRLDLIDSGRLIYGVDRRDDAERPSAGAITLDAALFAASRFDEVYLDSVRWPDALLAGGARPVTKAVLFPVRLVYTLHTGRIGQNDRAGRWYQDTGRPGHALAEAALTWRTLGLGDTGRAGVLLAADLPTLYRQLFTEYAHWARRRADHRLAGRFDDLSARLSH